MKIEQSRKLNFDDVMLAPQRSTLQSRRNIELEREFKFYHSPKVWKGLPLICANMSSLAGKKMCRALQKFHCITPLHKYHTENELIEIFSDDSINPDYVWMTIGFSDDDFTKLCEVSDRVDKNINIAIEVANGHIDRFVNYCKTIRKLFPESIIMAGNVACTSMVQEYIVRGGVDICKVGLGSGSVCETSRITGVGFPQFSLLSECSHVAHGLRNGNKKLGLICSDGGCKTIGDIAKSYAGGSDFTMVGGILAGAEECCGEWEYDVDMDGCLDCVVPHKSKMKYYGMSSKYAQEKHCGETKDYRASEGKEAWVDYKGPVENIIKEIKGGLRSCCTYSGAHSLKDLNKTAKFIVVK